MKYEDMQIIEQAMKNQRLIEIIEQYPNESLLEFNLRVNSFTSNIRHIVFDIQLTAIERSNGVLTHSVLINYNFAEYTTRLGKRTRKIYQENLNKNLPRPKL
ncbi:hypothetical protein ROU88_05560 [Macrococcus capreoli]